MPTSDAPDPLANPSGLPAWRPDPLVSSVCALALAIFAGHLAGTDALAQNGPVKKTTTTVLTVPSKVVTPVVSPLTGKSDKDDDKGKDKDKQEKEEKEKADKEKKEKEEKEKKDKDEKEKKEKEEKEKKDKKDKNKDDEEADAPPPLGTVPVPRPENLHEFIRDEEAARVLGKALFWDMQVGSDGKTACATCHFHAGTDNRTRNAVGLPPNPAGVDFRGPNTVLKKGDFPFHRLKDPSKKDSPVVFDTGEIAGSQGVVLKQFAGIVEGSPVDLGDEIPDPVFQIDGVNTRRVEPRNSPTMINAVFLDRQFWDGRANRFFNGVDPFGDTNPNARVFKSASPNGAVTPVAVLIDNASLASQAVGPPLSDFEMSWSGRTFPDLGRKLLSLPPLALQEVHKNDSVLGPYANPNGKGLKSDVSYASLIRKAFKPEWWQGGPCGDFTHMEQNFSFYWGLAIQLYEETLISDDTPYDRYAKGDKKALSEKQIEGLKLFLNEGKCINCHGGPEFAGGTVREVRDQPIELMEMARGTATYDNGFYNIGVRPTAQDLGVGASHPEFGPFSLTLRAGVDGRVAVNGGMKTPSLRNIELTGPYMRNGGMSTLEQVVEFYARGADFGRENIDDLDPDVDGIGSIRGKQDKIDALVSFMEALTDDRVRHQRAPFDHPELIIPNGHSSVDPSSGVALDIEVVLPAVGAKGGPKLESFQKVLGK